MYTLIELFFFRVHFGAHSSTMYILLFFFWFLNDILQRITYLIMLINYRRSWFHSVWKINLWVAGAAYVAAPVNGQKGWISHLRSGHALDKSSPVTLPAASSRAAATVAIAVAPGALAI